MMYDLEVEKAVQIIREEGYNLVGLQLPEGLKDRATKIVKKIHQETNSQTIILGDPCYGACDVGDDVAEGLGCDALFHFGHSKIKGHTRVPVHYIEVKLEIDPFKLISKNMPRLPQKLGLITTVQHVHILDPVSHYLERFGKEVFVGGGRGRAIHRGQVLGCSFSNAKSISHLVDAFLYIGTGDFHPLGVALSTGKKTYALDLESGRLKDMDKVKEKVLRKRFARIAKASDAMEYGIIVGEKEGQNRMELARRLKGLLEEKNKTGFLISLREITPEALIPFRNLDAFVNTACPRISIDDAQRYPKPLLTPPELEVVLGERDWEDYQMDEIT